MNNKNIKNYLKNLELDSLSSLYKKFFLKALLLTLKRNALKDKPEGEIIESNVDLEKSLKLGMEVREVKTKEQLLKELDKEIKENQKDLDFVSEEIKKRL